MEPPVSYPQSDSYQGRQIYGKKSGCAKFGCFGIVGAIAVIIVIIVIGYYFVFPMLTPNSISGTLLDVAIVPTKDGKQTIWILTDGSFNFIKETSSPGRHSVGRSCYFCKTWTYVIDPETQKVISKNKTELEDIITQTDMVYHKGRVWEFAREYGENEPRIEAYNSETGQKVMDTKQFVAKFPELSAGLTEVHYDDKDFTVRVKTKDGRERLYGIEDDKLYKDYSEFNKVQSKDSSIISIPFLTGEDNSSGPRKKLIVATGPSASIRNNRSSLDHSNGDYLRSYEIDTEPAGEKVYLEGLIYFADTDCAIIIHLDRLGKVSDRIMTCVDLKTKKEKWTVNQDDMFDEMKIDENDDSFSSLFFTKDKIGVKRSGNLVLLQLQGKGIMGFDYSTGKKMFEMDI